MLFVATFRTDNLPVDQNKRACVVLRATGAMHANSIAARIVRELNDAPRNEDFWVYSVSQPTRSWEIDGEQAIAVAYDILAGRLL